MEEGATPEQVDRVLTNWGMAMGIFAVDDMGGLDVAWRVRQELHQFERDGLFITLGGETSFDIVINGNDKSFPLRALLNEGFGRISYVADALFKGGNDEAVLTFIEEWSGPLPCPVEAIRVENWRETIGVLDRLGVINSTLA